MSKPTFRTLRSHRTIAIGALVSGSTILAGGLSGSAALANPYEPVVEEGEPLDEEEAVVPGERETYDPAPAPEPVPQPVPVAVPVEDNDHDNDTVINETHIVNPPPVIVQEKEDDELDHLVTPAGMAVRVGGGVMNFVDRNTRGFTDAGGAWEARLTYGTRSPLAAELAYIGSAQDIRALGLDSRAALLGSGGEAALRLNFLDDTKVQPYGLVGVGLTNYRIVNERFNTSSVSNSDNVYHIPIGAGLGFRAGGFLVDLRGTYRSTFDAEINATADDVEASSTDSNLDNWTATASAGVEF